jgi:hemerythrin-like metal-binding protein
MAFSWGSYFETGIAIVDQQHKGLVDLINETAPMLTQGGAAVPDQLDGLLAKLFAYAAAHFSTEEALMDDHGLLESYRMAHKGSHGDFVVQISELRSQLGTDTGGDLGPALLRYLTSWLTFHILNEDQRMARQISLLESGRTPEAAFAESLASATNDKALMALSGALIDLYAVLGTRNKALRATNEHLKLATRKLEETNLSLEARIDERTAMLRETVERMEQTQGQLLQSEKMAAIGQLAAGVAHEINNPVGFVNSNLGSLRKYVEQLLDVIDAYDSVRGDIPDSDARRQRIEAARAAADIEYLRSDIVDLLDESSHGLSRVKKIVQDLKDFSHVDEVAWQHTDLNAGLESTLNVVWNEIKYKATVEKHYGDLPLVPCVSSQINQVFMNLLVNAAQAIEGQGKITLSTGVAEGAWVEIRDTGKGMTEEVQKRIFEPFFTTKPVGKGTGLGLSISWDIVVKKHGGKISVSSEPGKGTCFRIELPLSADGEPAKA